MNYDTSKKPVDKRYQTFLKSFDIWQIYSQFGEESIIEAIFKRIGAANKWCAECGAGDGLFFSNTRRLIEQGCESLQIEGDKEAAARLIERYKDNDRVRIAPEYVKGGGNHTLDTLLELAGAPRDIDLLVIDVDGQDYYLFNSLTKYQPRVVICEYDPHADRMFIPEYDGKGQAGIDAIRMVANARGYEPICATRTNLICVKHELARFLEDGETAAEMPGVGTLQPAPPTLKIGAVMSTPRIGFLSNSDCILQALGEFGIPLARNEGAWWQHSLTRAIERQLEYGAEFILTIDYDSIFTSKDIAKLVCFLDDNPQIDVAVPLQQKREGGELLASTAGAVTLDQPGIPIIQGHFGLTLFRASVFKRLSRPWFYERPDPNGSWNENRLDADMGFWENCQRQGVRVYLALTTVIGHLEQVVTWPDIDRKPLYQPLNNWRERKMQPPDGVFQRELIKPVTEKLDMGA